MHDMKNPSCPINKFVGSFAPLDCTCPPEREGEIVERLKGMDPNRTNCCVQAAIVSVRNEPHRATDVLLSAFEATLKVNRKLMEDAVHRAALTVNRGIALKPVGMIDRKLMEGAMKRIDTDVADCPKCGRETTRMYHLSGHERDSTYDWSECTVCGQKFDVFGKAKR